MGGKCRQRGVQMKRGVNCRWHASACICIAAKMCKLWQLSCLMLSQARNGLSGKTAHIHLQKIVRTSLINWLKNKNNNDF